MALSHTQFEYLTEMGIGLWASKSVVSQTNEETPYLEIDQETLSTSKCFNDILTALGTGIDDASFSATGIDLGAYNWHFHDHDDIEYADTTLTTPPIEKISQSLEIKRKLWQVICQHQLAPSNEK